MKNFSLKAVGAAILTAAFFFAGMVAPAQAVSPATSITSTPASSTVLSGGTTPAFSIETNGSPDQFTQASRFKLDFIDSGGHAFMPLSSCVMATTPTWANCGITGVTRAGVSVLEQNAPVTISYMGGRNYITITYSSILAGDSVGISFASGAFSVGTETNGSTNFNAEMYFYTSSDNGSGSISATNGTFVRVLPPALYPSSLSFTGTTANPPGSNSAFSTQGLVGNVTYATTLTIPGYDFSSYTGRYTRNSNAVTATTGSGTITATGATSGSATATVTVNITQSVASLTIGGGSSYTQNGQVGSSLSSPFAMGSNFGGQITYSASSVPSGLTFSSLNGSFSGAPTSTSSAVVTITATGATSGTATATITFNIVSGGGQNQNQNQNVIPAPTVNVSLGTGCLNDVIIVPSNFGYSNGFWGFGNDAPPSYYPSGLSITPSGRLQGTLSNALTYTNSSPYRNMAVFYFPNGTTNLSAMNSLTSAQLHLTNGSSCTVSPGAQQQAQQNPRPVASMRLSINPGARVHNAPVPVAATGLQPSAPFTVEVHSTPIVIASGTVASDGTANYLAAIPAGLEAGWHTMIFTSIAADGTSFTSTYYFKVGGDGTLLSTSETIPAELAYTGSNGANESLLLFGGLSLALVGAEMFMIARRKRSN